MNLATESAVEGVIVFSHSLDVLHISPYAKQLLQPALSPMSKTPAGTLLPNHVHDVAREFRHAIQASLSHGKGLSCGVEHVLPMPNGACFVRGFGLPGRSSTEFLTVIVISTSPIPSLSTHGIFFL